MPVLSEAESKALLAAHGIPVPEEELVRSPVDAALAAGRIGFPVVAKLCGAGIAHKTERGLVRLTPAQAQAIGVTYTVVQRGPLDRTVRTVGQIVPAESRLAEITTKIDGKMNRISGIISLTVVF